VAVDAPAWVRDAVFYQIFPDRFAASARVDKPGRLEPWDAPPTVHGFKGGDLLGVVEHLEHLERLGVNAIYFNPVFASASNHRYHTYDYLAVDPLLGGDDALRELLDACHSRGMRVVLDGVFNHASRGFWPFHHVLETGAASPYRDWFYFNAEDLDTGRQIRAYPDETIGHALDVSDVPEEQRRGAQSLQVLGYQAWWDMPALPKINVDNPDARAYLLGVAEHWIRFGIDGWRLDVATEVPDVFWREFRSRVRAINPDAFIVAEIWREHPEYVQGDMYDALMNYPLAEAIISFVGGERLDRRVVAQHYELGANIRPEGGPAFAARLERAMTVYDPAVTSSMLNLLDSHDTPRVLSMLGGDAAGVALATFVQMTLPGAPSIFYGDEIGMPGEMDPFCRAAMRWDESTWNRELHAATTGAIALRRANPTLRHGSFGPLGAAGRWCAWRRDGDAGTFVVVVNAGDVEAAVEVALPDCPGLDVVAEPWRRDEAARPSGMIGEDGWLRLRVPARDGLALRVAP
jgi:cyclomaltodextrinase